MTDRAELDALRWRVRGLEEELRRRTSFFEATNEALAKAFAELRASRRALDDDLREAAQLQRALLPRLTPTPSIQCAAIWQPVEAVGGDWYDMARTEAGALRVLLADVPGHGVQAAMRTMILKTIFDRHKHKGTDPATLLSLLNADLLEVHPRGGLRVTAVCLDIGPREVQLAVAAQPSPVHVRGGVSVEVECLGPFLGVVAGARFPMCAIDIRRGDRLFVFTDGFIESWDREGAPIAPDALYAHLGRGALEEAMAAAVEALHGFRGGPATDDLTLLGFERRDPPDEGAVDRG